MPASIHLSREQIQVLAEQNAGVVVNETHLVADALDCWVLDETLSAGTHRSLVIEEDGTVISDAIMPSE